MNFQSQPLPEIAQALDQTAQHATSDLASGGQMAWRVWGEGEPVLLIHGGAGSWMHWLPTIPMLLEAGFQVIAPDLPGFGQSDALPSDHQLADIGAALHTGLRSLIGEARLTVVGFSFGGVAAGSLLPYLKPEQIRRFIPCGSGGLGTLRPDVEPLIKWRDLEGEARVEAHRRNLAILMIADPLKIDDTAIAIQTWNAEHSRGVSRSFSRTDALHQILVEVRPRITGIWGDKDVTALGFFDEREALLKAIASENQLFRIQGVGHWLQFEAPNEFNPLLRSILLADLQGEGLNPSTSLSS